MSSCEHKTLSDEDIQILTGVLMGDGNVDMHFKNSRFSCSNINVDYLNYLDKNINIPSEVNISNTKEECVERDIDSGFNKNAEVENYSDIYRWRTISHPVLNKFNCWYSSGKKKFPESIELSPTVLKHWYCCDGSYNINSGYNSISIGVSNEIGNRDKINSYFKEKNLPKPSWSTRDRVKGDGINACIWFKSKETDILFDYMGDPLPGFEYKWPDK